MVTFVDLLLVALEIYLVKKSVDGFEELKEAIKNMPTNLIPIHKFPPLIPIRNPNNQPLIPLRHPSHFKPPDHGGIIPPANTCGNVNSIPVLSWPANGGIPPQGSTSRRVAQNSEGGFTQADYYPVYTSGQFCGWNITTKDLGQYDIGEEKVCLYNFPNDVTAGGHVVYSGGATPVQCS